MNTCSSTSASSSAAIVYDAAERRYEYLEHTADIKVHAWGPTLELAFCAAAIGMIGCITEVELIKIDPAEEGKQITAAGHDLPSLLYSFLDEILFLFHSEFFLTRKLALGTVEKTNSSSFTLAAELYGEHFD
eukprot:CAMPEP_0185841598 /NCGR_PEP_ID=MMETSP1353-20130828/17977_1 /TAXON_ID=1077150 /ORGANISM="Erythrolobus australicus, Strain CCMP3124" /LENGTH=131 /DNA_ID=CAMNT_0028541079 /DNA_START=554 /DNA_END=946 /DNA_ORIENTATION=+